MSNLKYTIGVDFGSNSARALLVCISDGRQVAQSIAHYPSGDMGIHYISGEPHVARQYPPDYLLTLEQTIKDVLHQAHAENEQFDAQQVIGIGIDTTGSTPMPLDAHGHALCMSDDFKDNLNAYAWLWKDHTAHEEARMITEQTPCEWMKRIGGKYSSEWYWAKIWRCATIDPQVAQAAADWVEIADWIPAVLAGSTQKVIRGVCAAGHKALYAQDLGGLPPREVFSAWHSALAKQHDVLSTAVFQDSEHAVGTLTPEWAEKLGLSVDVVIATGAFDAHFGAIGAGVKNGCLVKVIGTSTCDITIAPAQPFPQIAGVCGVVNGSVVSNHVGIEAGQSAVGDLLAWWVNLCQSDHHTLMQEATLLQAGESGLLALDWNNGNRTILIDQRLTGLLVGQTMMTSRAEIYRALIEATAFGARMIIERIELCGIPIHEVIVCGGIAQKNPLFMSIYADVLGRTIHVSASEQTCALGGVICAAVAANDYANVLAAQAVIVPSSIKSYQPDVRCMAIYQRLFILYQKLHDDFGQVKTADMGQVMKALLDLSDEIKLHNKETV